MKTLIESTESSATYEFTEGDATRRITFKAGPQVTEEVITQDFEVLADAEHEQWLNWLNSSQPLDENGIEINQ